MGQKDERGFTDYGEEVATRLTAQQKVNFLELMLGQIANYCPIIARNTLVKNSTSIQSIWNTIRPHFGFQIIGAYFIDFADIHLESNEIPEDLYQRLMAFVEDILLKANSLSHHGDLITEDEELSPSFENFVVLIRLKLVHPDLPRFVKQRYGTELRSRTLASIKPGVSQAQNSLLDEIRASDDAKVMRTVTVGFRRSTPIKSLPRKGPRPPRQSKSCPLCQQAGRPDPNHFLSECRHLPEEHRKYIAKARQIANIVNDHLEESDESAPFPSDCESNNEISSVECVPEPAVLRVQTRQFSYIDTFHAHPPVRITLDSGATGNMIRHSLVTRLGGQLSPSSQSAHQADGCSPLKVVGETRLSFTRANREFSFEGLVVENLDVDVLAGTPFMETNHISIRPAKRQVTIGDGPTYAYGSQAHAVISTADRRAIVLRAPPTSTTIWPGDFVEIKLPDEAFPDCEYALEPRSDAPSIRKLTASQLWPPPSIVSSVAGKIRIPNLSSEPHSLKRNEHFCQVNPVFSPAINVATFSSPSCEPCPRLSGPTGDLQHNSSLRVDPENALLPDIRAKLQELHDDYDEVFDPRMKGYSAAAGSFEAQVNMGPIKPPQRKGRLPQYGRNKLVELQEKFDQLEELGVFKRPEDIGISIEYLNPSFLVKKQSGGYRLVTAFADVGRYSKRQPSVMPDVDSTLRHIAQWKHLIATDLTTAFYQIPLSQDSIKYCGVATPLKGVGVYVRSAMGMPGLETALEELMCRVLVHLLQEGIVVKIADDLYCDGNTSYELL